MLGEEHFLTTGAAEILRAERDRCLAGGLFETRLMAVLAVENALRHDPGKLINWRTELRDVEIVVFRLACAVSVSSSLADHGNCVLKNLSSFP